MSIPRDAKVKILCLIEECSDSKKAIIAVREILQQYGYTLDDLLSDGDPEVREIAETLRRR